MKSQTPGRPCIRGTDPKPRVICLHGLWGHLTPPGPSELHLIQVSALNLEVALWSETRVHSARHRAGRSVTGPAGMGGKVVCRQGAGGPGSHAIAVSPGLGRAPRGRPSVGGLAPPVVGLGPISRACGMELRWKGKLSPSPAISSSRRQTSPRLATTSAPQEVISFTPYRAWFAWVRDLILQ